MTSEKTKVVGSDFAASFRCIETVRRYLMLVLAVRSHRIRAWWCADSFTKFVEISLHFSSSNSVLLELAALVNHGYHSHLHLDS